MIKYKSKIGLTLLIPVLLVFSIVLVESIIQKPDWLAIGIISLPMAFVLHIFLNTSYTINGDKLNIKCGFFSYKPIDIKSISKMTETNNPLSSPAASLDRLEIHYGNSNSIIISPKDKLGFINDIKRLNPEVEVKYKKS